MHSSQTAATTAATTAGQTAEHSAGQGESQASASSATSCHEKALEITACLSEGSLEECKIEAPRASSKATSEARALQEWEKGRLPQALRFIEESLLEEETADKWNTWASIQVRGGNSRAGELGYRRALEREPHFGQAAANLGAVLANRGQFQAALQMIEKALGESDLDITQQAAAKQLLERCRLNLARKSKGEKTVEGRAARAARLEMSDCLFYHTMRFPDNSEALGHWDISAGSFADYIGNMELRGKTVLDVGTASGFLSFEAERRGAIVTAYEIDSAASAQRIPFRSNLFYTDYAAWLAQADAGLERLINSFWYARRQFHSNVQVVYASLPELPACVPEMDIVIAGAIFEHLSDPVSTIGILSKIAKETIVLAFTPIVESDELLMKSITNMDEPQYDYTWFAPSTGLLRRAFENVGFRIARIGSSRQYARYRDAWETRPTIVARRFAPML
jgi:tetratricopeptide (TPR) repeat protein